ncbi:MAG: GAF domain-containing protein [Desulfobacteraceae bacterium]|nr:GAF domain-containing protein [Desulfobacteraceae bacterium]
MTRHYRLANKMSQLFNSDSDIDTTLSISMYNFNQLMDSERSSIFLFQPLKEQLSIFSSFDLEKHEIRIPKSVGVAGWVFENRKPAVVNNAYEDSRFFREVDDMTGFHTRNLICTPLFDCKDQCLGALQSLNKKNGDFTTDDLEFLELAARIVAIAIDNSKLIGEIVITDEARKRLINQIIHNIGKVSDEQ